MRLAHVMPAARIVSSSLDVVHLHDNDWGGGGGGTAGFNFPLPVPVNPVSRPILLASRFFAVFRLRNIAQCCVISPCFSGFLPHWESRFPPHLLPAPVHLPGFRPPVPLHDSRAQHKKCRRILKHN